MGSANDSKAALFKSRRGPCYKMRSISVTKRRRRELIKTR